MPSSATLVSFTTDLDTDALYIQIRRGQVARTEELDDWTLVDVDAEGRPLGIEVIHGSRPWPLQRFINRYGIDPQLATILSQSLPHSLQQSWAAYQAHTSSTSLDVPLAAAL